ncbi:hypothetical protein EV421DRAFT_1734172 [Armillaria borealis]|uniref:FHA domain-containing protein n=1 Tax=Armillaria borealis TaxID=47425 RepID=A0AA39JT62_9AGAR|nr:hypothetical protein EV421DRAFT_1734172 [Armillaria borealis]
MPAPTSSPGLLSPIPALYLYPLNDSFVPKHISLQSRVKIGRQTNAKTTPGERNGYFDSKVLSRQHAEVWEENGKIYIKDVKSSNGTFINGERLSPEGVESENFELKSDDIVEFGIDIVGEDNKTIVHHKVAARVVCVYTEQDAMVAARSEQASHSLGPAPVSSFNPPAPPGPVPGRRPGGLQAMGMGGMGGSMRPPGKSGLTFEHILSRLQGELQKSRETGAELGALTGAMGEIGEVLGGGSGSAMPVNGALPPVRPPAQVVEERTEEKEKEKEKEKKREDEGAAVMGEVQKQLADTQHALDVHVEKVRELEEKLKEQENMWREIRSMIVDGMTKRNEVDDDEDDAQSVTTITERELETVEEVDEREEDEPPQERVRPKTPEPGMMDTTNTRHDWSSVIDELSLKVGRLTDQLAGTLESAGVLRAQHEAAQDVIRGLEKKVERLEGLLTERDSEREERERERAGRWEDMIRRVDEIERRQKEEKKPEAEVVKVFQGDGPPSPRSLSSDSDGHDGGGSGRPRRRGRRGRSMSIPPPNDTDVDEDGYVKVEDQAKKQKFKEAKGRQEMLTVFGVIVVGMAVAGVVWKVKE